MNKMILELAEGGYAVIDPWTVRMIRPVDDRYQGELMTGTRITTVDNITYRVKLACEDVKAIIDTSINQPGTGSVGQVLPASFSAEPREY